MRNPKISRDQFRRNDSHGPDRPESTDAASSYKEYLRRYIDDARARGATPLLVTPMCRRVFRPDGKLDDALSPYANAMKEVAAERKAGVIDLHTTSGELFQNLGDAGSAELANKTGDRTAIEVPSLIEILRKPANPSVSYRTLLRLAKAREEAKGAVPAILPMLNHGDWRVRNAATNALTAIGHHGK